MIRSMVFTALEVWRVDKTRCPVSAAVNARDIQFEVYITNVTMGSSTGEISNVEFTWEANGAPYTNTTMIN